MPEFACSESRFSSHNFADFRILPDGPSFPIPATNLLQKFDQVCQETRMNPRFCGFFVAGKSSSAE